MASWLPSFGFSYSLGRNVLFGVSVGLGIGIGIGAGMVLSRKIFPLQAQDQKLVVHLTELANETRELRLVLVKLEVCFSESRPKRKVPRRDQVSVQESDEEETDLDEYYEMSGEEHLERFVKDFHTTPYINYTIMHQCHTQKRIV